MKLLTIYTPTYNRAGLLPRVYESLCRQTNINFIWLIIDDGSTDNTKKLVEEWSKEAPFIIEYIYKENGGIHTARDAAYHACKTELIVGCDSDDWLTDTAVENWLECWEKYGSDDTIGIFSVVIDENGNRVSSNFPARQYLSYQEFTYKYKCQKEKQTLIKTSIISRVPDAPIYDGEKIVGEVYKWIQLPEEKRFILLDIPTRVYEQQSDGYIKGVSESRFKNPNGFRIVYIQMIKYGRYLSVRLKGHLGYIAFSQIIKDKDFIKKSPNPLITLLMFPVGYYIYNKFKRERSSCYSSDAEKNNNHG